MTETAAFLLLIVLTLAVIGRLAAGPRRTGTPIDLTRELRAGITALRRAGDAFADNNTRYLRETGV